MYFFRQPRLTRLPKKYGGNYAVRIVKGTVNIYGFMADIFILPITQQPKRERLRLSIWSQHGQLSTNVL